MKLIIPLTAIVTLAACTTKNDVAIQTAHANSRAQECVAVSNIAASGAASEAAVLMAARGCGAGPSPRTGADRAASVIAAISPIAGALVNGAVAIEQGKIAAGTQSENIAAGTIRAGIDASVLTTLGKDQVVTVRPEVITAPDPVIVQAPEPVIVQPAAPEIVQLPAPQVCSNDEGGNLVCQ